MSLRSTNRKKRKIEKLIKDKIRVKTIDRKSELNQKPQKMMQIRDLKKRLKEKMK